jgi:ubiquinone/menaquinone biosynthesis C-methylase UbiE
LGEEPNMINRILRQIKRKGLLDTINLSYHIVSGLMGFYLNPYSKRQSKLSPQNYEKIRSDFESSGITVIPYRVNVDEFNNWLDKASFPKEYVNHYGSVFIEKALEHYVGAQLLELKEGDKLIDIAASSSPWSEISKRLYGCTAYALDIAFPKGVNGNKIGADATDTPLPDNFATKMALHCAYEMFESDADIRLLSEAKRVLNMGGKMVILPLYMHNFYFADSSPLADRRKLDYQGAMRVWRDDGHRIRFSRKYSVKSFIERVVYNLNGLQLKVYFIENEKELSSDCYLKFAAVFEK